MMQAVRRRIASESNVALLARIGLLTGGGDCPGLNAVIRAIVRKGINHYGHEFVGFRHGWAGVLDNESVPLSHENTRGILHRGGTILGTSRTNPYKEQGGLERLKQTLADRGIDALIPIGGEDTLGVARRLVDRRRRAARHRDDRRNGQ